MRRKPSVFLVGAPKSGSTAMYEFLKQHPDIFMAEPKEIGFFCTDRIRESDRFHSKKKHFPYRTQSKYLSLFRDWKDEKVAGEGTTAYLHSKEAAQNIHNFNPNAKIIIMIREPVDYIHSLYHQFKGGKVETESFERSLEKEKSWKKGEQLPPKIAFPAQLFYTELATFSTSIQRYFRTFGRSQVKVILFDEFNRDNRKTFSEVTKFIGVDNTFTPAFKKINYRHKIQYRPLKNIAEHPLVWKFWKAVLPQKAYKAIKRKLYKFIKIPVKHQKIKPSLKERLMKKFKPEVKRLSELLDRDLVTQWNYDKITTPNPKSQSSRSESHEK
ncbi:sulfotransferase domain-containing protein [Candidatus Woesearchaeota archaeon]|nr:sulfotransferase domain-containing protein [Candidatus Woesearchaeota archaeon]